ncbi:MAG: integration host factor subunit alpha [Chromatiales bacterium]|nr:integration host factor subunit alpha [Chromatiales bacterium]
MTITKADLAKNLVDKLGFNKHESNEFVRLLFEEIVCNLEKSIDVKISGFGNFMLHDKRQRIGRNPRTGEPAVISARRVVVFRAGQKLKDRMAPDDGSS